MKILFLTFYFEPDLSAGSFRNSSLFKTLSSKITSSDSIDVITTSPNRYTTFKVKSLDYETIGENTSVRRIKVQNQKSGFFAQIKSFKVFYFETLKFAKQNQYDLVYASSGRLFTAFLAARLAKKNKAKLYLDIRDIFRETITDVYKKNKIIFYLLNFFIPFIERYTFNKANIINIVSPGFRDYFKKNNYGEKAEFQTYTNGIDDLFLNNTEVSVKRINKPKKQVIYAGNIGLSQSLDKTLPYVAKKLQETHEFHIYGDGAGKQNLLSKIKTNDSQNIFLHQPINREKLIDIYKNSDILYFQLADLKAFLRVIPSKLFEYSVYGKPIIAVVEGYSKSFVESKLDGCYVAEPNNVESIVDTINKINLDRLYERKDFIKKYSRRNINEKMSSSILNT